jgi:hypothetical protein
VRKIIAWFSAFTRIERELLDAKLERKTIMTTLQDVKDAFGKFMTDFEGYRASVKSAVDDALAKQAVGEAADLDALKASIDAADAEIAPAAAAATAATAPADQPSA